MRKENTKDAKKFVEVDSALLDLVSGGKGMGLDPNGGGPTG